MTAPLPTLLAIDPGGCAPPVYVDADPMLRAAADAGYLSAREYAEEVRRRQEQERARAAA